MTYHDNEQLAWQAMEAGDYKAALPLLKALAESNSEYALLSLGWIYEEGVLGSPDNAAARSFYEHAEELGSAEASGRLGSLLLEDGQEDQAEAALKRGAELGDELSRSMLEKLDQNRQEHSAYQAIEQGDHEMARRLLEALAARSSAYSLLALGALYEAGKLGPADTNLALSHYQRAASQGSAEAHRRIGQLLVDLGHEEQAWAAFERGAVAGHISCMYWLGKMMVDGRGGPAQINRGTEWLEAAAEQGHLLAKRKLLGLEKLRVNSAFKKLLIWCRILALAKEVAKEVWKDADSDKVR